MILLRLDHVRIGMPEGREDEARRFYGGLLGLREVPKPPELARRGGCWFEGGEGLRIHLGVRARGFESVEDAPIEGFDRIFTSDPFRNRIELMEPEA